MCGICGIVGGTDRQVLERMTATLAHRGPNDSGSVFFPPARLGLGQRRLSIIDLTARGHQAMSNEDGTLLISFNGEIYNYLELKKTLDLSRHQFASETDTEVILHLYEEHGTKAFAQLNGMFAFALYDAKDAK